MRQIFIGPGAPFTSKKRRDSVNDNCLSFAIAVGNISLKMSAFIIFSLLSSLVLRARSARRRRTLIRDHASFSKKRAAVVRAGVARTHFVVDFDRTLTSYFTSRGERGDSCHGVVEKREGIAEKAAALNAYYYAIETDPKRTKEEKTPFMIEWYHAVNGMLAASNISRSDVAADVAAARLEIRSGMRSLLDAARHHGLNVTVFSAGIGDVIVEVLAQRWAGLPALAIHDGERLPRSLRVVSNWMQWSSPTARDAICTGWSEPLIHMYNKHASSLLPADLEEVSKCSAVVLVGDSEGDVTMADGLGADTVLKIGFLNISTSHELVTRYAELFDVVLLDDAPAWEVEDIVRELIQSGP